MEVVLREHINLSNFLVVVRTGDTVKADDLEKVSVKDVRTVLVMSPADHTREAAVARTRHVLLTMRSMEWSRYGTCVVGYQLTRNFFCFTRHAARLQRFWYRVTLLANSLSGAVSEEASLESSH